MTAKILDGVQIAADVRGEVAVAVQAVKDRYQVTPGLAAILTGSDPASTVYVRNKRKACESVGIFSETFHLTAETSQNDLLDLIQKLNRDSRYHGILLQLPLPAHIDEFEVIHAIDPNKDVDGLHPENMGRLVLGNERFTPCTPAGIQEILARSNCSPSGLHAVICGRSNIVGKPLSVLLAQKNVSANATVTLCHTGTTNMGDITRRADILVVAIGRPNAITADMVQPGAIVIDVGINRIEDSSRKRGYRLVGDVDFAGVSEIAGAITPVPGGVGPMTIAMLLRNTSIAAREFAIRA